MISRYLLAIVIGTFSSSVYAGDLPDTGQASCFNVSGATACEDVFYPRQDGNNASALNYRKLDATGNELDASAVDWTCVRDNATGLLWEAKTNDAGVRDVAHRFVWVLDDPQRNGGVAGGSTVTNFCAATLESCTTEIYIDAVNASNYCGASDWRLPTQAELLTLVHAGNLKPAIDTAFFPNTASVPYWSSTTYAMTPAHAWGVHFGYGAAHAESKSVANAVRLVRGTWVK